MKNGNVVLAILPAGNGTQVEIVPATAAGYHVALRDTDADMVFPCILGFPSWSAAMAKATKLANGEGDRSVMA